ncbi:hypothetical protein [Mangrovicoccus sp. HB161399]|uniref:hypothetical protein n=1 Tax=Mangrovicoccus sp. HB161399 TaxID=2720392 RepID=UPI001554D22F|nr:hypothetical protein [Mangrovicoccus sp. HB161399]
MADAAGAGPGNSGAAAKPVVVVNRARAKRYSSAVALGSRRGPERKYNIKLLRQDYDVIKLAADMEGRSASYFVSFLIYDHIFRELEQMVGDSADALLLIAATADSSTEYDIMSTPWIYDLMADEIDEIVAQVAGTREADLEPVLQMVEKYKKGNSHLHQVVKLMIGS